MQQEPGNRGSRIGAEMLAGGGGDHRRQSQRVGRSGGL